jgi:hypothetical protein
MPPAQAGAELQIDEARRQCQLALRAHVWFALSRHNHRANILSFQPGINVFGQLPPVQSLPMRPRPWGQLDGRT